jgi:hypothetical protein
VVGAVVGAVDRPKELNRHPADGLWLSPVGTEGSEVQILSPRPKKIDRNGLRLTVMVGRRPFLLVVLQTFAAQANQYLEIRPDFVSAMVGGERP